MHNGWLPPIHFDDRPGPLLSRREFMGLTGGAALLATAAGASAARGRSPLQGKVLKYADPSLTGADGEVNQQRVAAALDECLLKLSGANDAGAAWRAVVSPDEVVGLKVSCQAGRQLCTHPVLVMAVVDRLTAAGIPPENIIIWDRKDRELERCGFTLNSGAKGVKCVGTDGADGYDKRVSESGRVATRLSRIQSVMCDCTINMPVLKDHLLSGITAAMKNHYGSIDNPNKFHDNGCNPYIADLYAMPSVRGKERLIICDALRPAFKGGPDYNPSGVWAANTLLVGCDPVALDYVGWYMVEKKRQEVGEQSLTQLKRKPSYIYTAAKYGLGITKPSSTRLVRIGPRTEANG